MENNQQFDECLQKSKKEKSGILHILSFLLFVVITVFLTYFFQWNRLLQRLFPGTKFGNYLHWFFILIFVPSLGGVIIGLFKFSRKFPVILVSSIVTSVIVFIVYSKWLWEVAPSIGTGIIYFVSLLGVANLSCHYRLLVDLYKNLRAEGFRGFKNAIKGFFESRITNSILNILALILAIVSMILKSQ